MGLRWGRLGGSGGCRVGTIWSPPAGTASPYGPCPHCTQASRGEVSPEPASRMQPGVQAWERRSGGDGGTASRREGPLGERWSEPSALSPHGTARVVSPKADWVTVPPACSLPEPSMR